MLRLNFLVSPQKHAMPSSTKSPMISLREVNVTTVRAVTNLRVRPEQEGYVASNAVSIAQAYFAPDAWFRSIYSEEELIGFAMLRDATILPVEAAKPEISLWRFMIAHEHQRLGYGRDALKLLVAHVRTKPGVTSLETSYVQGPHGPKDFYLSFGFVHNGEIKANGEVCLRLDLA